MKIGQRIRKIRELRGYKQDAMAERLNMSQANYSKLENEDADMPFSRLEEIAKVLEVTVEEIVCFDKKAFFNNKNSTYNTNNINSPVSINDRQLFEEIISSKDKTIAVLENQVSLLQSILKNK
ncbi:MAG: helix-turn-helix transcriptional regulator [Cytophagales bacterium]